MGIVNAFWQGREVVLVNRDGDKVTAKRVRAQNICYFKIDELDSKSTRYINNHPAIVRKDREGEWLRTEWADRRVMRRDIEEGGLKYVQTYEADVDPVRRFLTDHEITFQTPRRCYLDIETDSRRSFEDASRGHTRVLCWSIHDDEGNSYHDYLEDDTDQDEKLLLESLWHTLLDYDLVAAWSGNSWSSSAKTEDVFDFVVVWSRSKYLDIRVEPRKWLWLSHLGLYKRLNISGSASGEEKQSLALDAVLKSLDLGSKFKFDASKTWEAWAAGGKQRDLLVEYNNDDALACRKIEKKTGYIDLHYFVSKTCNSFPDTRTVNPTSFVDGYMLKLGKKHGVHYTTKYGMTQGKPFDGAIVLPTIAGAHRDVNVFDFSGMYPSIICTWNISPETLVRGGAKVIYNSPEDQWVVANKYGVKKDPFIRFDVPKDCSVAPFTQQVFRTDKKGMVPIALEDLLAMRSKVNKEQAALDASNPRWGELDRLSKAAKIVINSFYGVTGSPFSRYYIRECAESTSTTGVWLIRLTQIEGLKRGLNFVAGDTDSGFVRGLSDEELEEFTEYCNNDLYPDYIKRFGCKTNTVSLGYEKKFSLVVFTTKKRYAGKFSHYKGTKVSGYKEEIKGLEYKRGDSTRLARALQKTVVENLLREEIFDVKFYCKLLDEWSDRVLKGQLDPADIVASKSLGKPLEEYVQKPLKNGGKQPFSEHIRVAHILRERGRAISEGTRIQYVVTNARTSPMTVIPWEDFDGKYDLVYQWENLIYPPTQRILQAALPDGPWRKYEKAKKIPQLELF